MSRMPDDRAARGSGSASIPDGEHFHDERYLQDGRYQERGSLAPSDSFIPLVVELQAIGQTGLYYAQDVFDRERYTRIRQIAAQMLSSLAQQPVGQIEKVFLAESGYQTPKIDTRAAIIRNNKILLVQETSGKWALPGGWVDVNLSVAENTAKEAQEEAGVDVRPKRLIAVIDKRKHNHTTQVFGIISFFVECEYVSGEFMPNSETLAARYYEPDRLPELELTKNTPEQIAMCFAAHQDQHWIVPFD
ncbi:MAG: NUDIX hydrolase [Actinomycetaceae bacterium]|nr:NUDIX hydrolase [Actinomycetaceae bacterium]MDY6082370.1 NUDIX hydrolase [Actinomycetaceae bacterium]